MVTRDEIRKRKFAILVEGYLDLIIPYQFGVRNMVASLGTALTTEQAKLMGRFARKVVVNYDGDRAGVQAAKKSIEILLAEDLEVKVLVLPENADPDEFIRKFGGNVDPRMLSTSAGFYAPGKERGLIGVTAKSGEMRVNFSSNRLRIG